VPPGDDFRLGGDELALRAFAGRLVAQVARLVGAERPDWGFAALVGMARLAALDQSLARGRLVFLDAFPPGHDTIDRAAVARHADVLPQLLDHARAELVRARRALTETAEPGEAEFADVESASNRVLALRRALTEDRDLPVHRGRLVPSRPAERADLVLPAAGEGELERALAAAEVREREYATQLERLYRYKLVTRNCVSEIFRTVEDALAGPARVAVDGEAAPDLRQVVRSESTRRLGGYVRRRWSLHFIPLVSAMAVETAYRVTAREEVPSYRTARLAELAHHEDALRVYLRESNVLTSTIYRRSSSDSVFVFFTDDALAPRPILGAVNLIAGVAASAVGVAVAPVDGGHLLGVGLRGALFSLPELAFVNLRKGSFDYVPDPGAGSS
jgi:hypothetical protein